MSVPCPECGRYVSDTCRACPNCGFDVGRKKLTRKAWIVGMIALVLYAVAQYVMSTLNDQARIMTGH